MDTTGKFSGLAKDYTASRPAYSADFIDYLYNQYDFSRISVIADIGSGTGKFSKQLLDKQSEVYCVEPNNDMRLTAAKELCKYTNFHSVVGSAEQTMLKNDFADHITTAQAFHWFDIPKFKQECLRIIKPGGNVFLIWNIRDFNSSINQAWHKVFLQYCPNFHGFGNGIKQDDAKIKTFFDNRYNYIAFNHPLFFSRENFIKRSLSSSYSLKKSDTNYDKYIAALNRLFEMYENNGFVTIPNQTVAYVGIIK